MVVQVCNLSKQQVVEAGRVKTEGNNGKQPEASTLPGYPFKKTRTESTFKALH